MEGAPAVFREGDQVAFRIDLQIPIIGLPLAPMEVISLVNLLGVLAVVIGLEDHLLVLVVVAGEAWTDHLAMLVVHHLTAIMLPLVEIAGQTGAVMLNLVVLG